MVEENKIKSNKVDAKLAFKAIRDYYLIDPSLSDKDARKILIVRDLSNLKVTQNISQ